jgi:predicted transcriptional regulator|tara:strand:- start:92 stop:334 length:243 start_codon:yes stop_codon:yes gene_type:complete
MMDQMSLFEHFIKILKERQNDVKELMARGGVDSMERYQYMLGQIRTYESLLQEISTLLNKKEQNEKGTVISIRQKSDTTK